MSETERTPIMNAAGLIAIHAALATIHQDAPTLIGTHSALDTGVHGVGGSTLQSLADIVALIATHAGLPNVHHTPPSPLTVAETEVFNGNSPAAWTDLDLSGVVGANAALVLLKVHTTVAAWKFASFRRNGDTDQQYNASTFHLGSSDNNVTIWTVVAAVTDNAGIVEWITEGVQDFTVDVIGYVN